MSKWQVCERAVSSLAGKTVDFVIVDIIHQYWGRAAVVSFRKSCQFSDWRNSGFVVVDIVHHYSGVVAVASLREGCQFLVWRKSRMFSDIDHHYWGYAAVASLRKSRQFLSGEIVDFCCCCCY